MLQLLIARSENMTSCIAWRDRHDRLSSKADTQPSSLSCREQGEVRHSDSRRTQLAAEPDESPSIHLAKLPTFWHNFLLPLSCPWWMARQSSPELSADSLCRRKRRGLEVNTWREMESIKTNRKQESTWGQAGHAEMGRLFFFFIFEDQLEFESNRHFVCSLLSVWGVALFRDRNRLGLNTHLFNPLKFSSNSLALKLH